MRYFLNGNEILSESPERDQSIAGCPVRCVTADPHTGQVSTFAFTKQEDFRDWYKTMPFGEKIDAASETIANVRKFEGSDHKRAIVRQRVLTERVIADLHELAEHLTLPLDSKELFLAAHQGTSLLDPPVLHSTILFENRNCGGKFFPVISFIPFFDLGAFRNRTSSLRVFGQVAIWTGTWFKGNVFYFIGLGQCFELSDTLFNDNVESAFAF